MSPGGGQCDEQVLHGDRLVNDPEGSRQARVVVPDMLGGHDDHRHSRVLRVNHDQELSTVHGGHRDVGHHGEWSQVRQRFQRHEAIRSHDDGIPLLTEEVGDRFYPVRIIVDDENDSLVIGHLSKGSKKSASGSSPRPTSAVYRDGAVGRRPTVSVPSG
jgi:hypothetical protein